jgi:hypothetical protein
VERCEELIEVQVAEFLSWARQRPEAVKPSLSAAP